MQAGSTDWTAFFFGSSDAGNAITVDKPPASLWLMALSVRLFGLSSWSILVPEALLGVASVGVLYATVRRRFSAGTALLAGVVLAVTPVAALMFRYNNPDALLVLLLSLATYCTLRGIETGQLKWVLWAGAMVGLGFLTKQLQAFLILPALASVYVYAAPHRLFTRVWHSLAALGVVLFSAGWWVAIVELLPADWRPYVGGSKTNSFLELTFGYNGFGRLIGNKTGSVAGDAVAPAVGTANSTGILRIFRGEVGGQVTWLLPAALLLLCTALIVLRHAQRVSLRRATLLLFAGHLLVSALAFSFMAGIFHAYYTLALAPALAGTAAIGASLVWMKRKALWARIIAAVAILMTCVWAWVLLDRTIDWLPWLKFIIAMLGVLATVLLLAPPRAGKLGPPARTWIGRVTVAAALGCALMAPVAYSLQTVLTPHTGSFVTAGPNAGGGTRNAETADQGGSFPPPATGGADGPPPAQTGALGRTGPVQQGSTGIAALLTVNSGSYTWVAATIGSNRAASYQLATELPVMAVGGFRGTDPAPTLAQFQADVAAREIHYFIGGTSPQAIGRSSNSNAIARWVAATYTAQVIGGVRVYNLSVS